MANKIITLSSSTVDLSATDNLLVYADLNINASPAEINLKNLYTEPGGGTTSLLSQDLSNDTDQDDDFIDWEIDTGSSHLSGNIRIGTQLEHFNRWNAMYNAEQRKKSHYKLEKNVNLIAIKQSIHNIFTWQPGERIINPEFGSKLRSYLYEGITDYNQEQIMAEIRHCFSEWEPRAQLDKVINLTDADDRENNTVRIEIQYSVPSLNARQFSYVYEVTKAE